MLSMEKQARKSENKNIHDFNDKTGTKNFKPDNQINN